MLVLITFLSLLLRSSSFNVKKYPGSRLHYRSYMDPSSILEGIQQIQHTFSFSDIVEITQEKFSQLQHPPYLPSSSDSVVSLASQQAILDNPLMDGESGEGSLNPLGNDLLIFLCATIGIVPLFKWLDASPVIGLLMGPCGLRLFSDLNDMESLADFGVLFLLFEQGLELTVERLKGLSKFAFGMGSLQVILSTAAFFIFPFVGGVQFLEFIGGSDPAVVDINKLDEALVIGAALSLSSSAFVLKILQEKNQLSTRFGAACLGILLLQDIAVVPLLVLLPIIESSSGPMPLETQLSLLGATFLKALVGLGGILVVGGNIVRYLFSIVAKTQSSETFVALCLLVAVGIGAITDSLGLSSTLGAFAAGTLLAESNYRTQIESDIKPFKGLLLGLFFITTGASVDPFVIEQQWQTVLALLLGLVTFKASITTLLGPFFGLTKAESVRTGLILSGGGEFAFVVLTLGDKLNVLPSQLAKILVGVVVLSMALTPTLSKIGDNLATRVEEWERREEYVEAVESGSIMGEDDDDYLSSDMVVVCGYGSVGETIVRFLTSSTVVEQHLSSTNTRYIAFDLDPTLVMKGYRDKKRILYGDGSQPMVLATAGISKPKAFVVTYGDAEASFKAVERLRQAYPDVPILARSNDMAEYFHLLDAGATLGVSGDRETSLRMGSSLLLSLGLQTNEVSSVQRDLLDDLEDEDRGVVSEILARKLQNRVATEKVNRFYETIVRDTTDGDKQKKRSTSSLASIRPMLDEVARNFAGVLGGVRKLETDKNIEEEEEKSVSQEEEEVSKVEEGVTVCILPPRNNNSDNN